LQANTQLVGVCGYNPFFFSLSRTSVKTSIVELGEKTEMALTRAKA
jgi:hypothetical protein